MLHSICRFFSPPVFENDEESLKTRHLTLIAHIILLAALFYSILIPVFAPRLTPRIRLVIPIYPVILAVYWLVYKQKTRAASLLLVTGTWLVLFMADAWSGGTQAPAFAGNVIIILSAAVLIDYSTTMVFAALSAVSGLLIIWAQSLGYVPYASQPLNTPFSDWLAEVIYFAVAAALVYMATEQVRFALQRAQTELRVRRKIEAELKEQRDSAIQVMNELGQGLALTDRNSKYQYVNSAFARMLHYDPSFLIGKSPHDFVLAEDLPILDRALQPRRQEQTAAYEVRHITSTGDIVHASITGVPRIQNGQQEGTVIVATDLTERKRIENEQNELLKKMNRRNTQLHTAAEVSRAASSILDLETLMPAVVELIRERFNYYYVGLFLVDGNNTAVLRAATGEMGKKMLALGHVLDVSESSMIGWCIVHGEPRIALDVGKDAVRFKNPFLPLTRSEAALPLISRGNVIGAMTIQSSEPAAFSDDDITVLQTMMEQVANAIENARLLTERAALIKELESRNLELERFTYTVSHDLRSPLITMRGFAGFLTRDAQSGNMELLQKDVNRIIDATEKMQQLLNELLELSRVGRIMNPTQDIPFHSIVEEALERVRGQLEKYGVRVKVQENLPVVRGDPTRLIEVVQNLVDNAAKFMGDQPQPVIEIGISGTEPDGFAVFFVRDNGIGIEPKFHERIFGLFNKLNPDSEGTGVGLALVKRIVEVHGGKIRVESTGKGGTTFYFSLPLKT